MKKRPPLDLKRSNRRVLIAATIAAGGAALCGCGTHPFMGTAVNPDSPCSVAQLADTAVTTCCYYPETGALNQPECTDLQKEKVNRSQRCCPTASDNAPRVGIAPSNPPAEATCTTDDLSQASMIKCCETPAANAVNQSQCTTLEESDLTAGFDRCCPTASSS